jgi:hypothetical protein
MGKEERMLVEEDILQESRVSDGDGGRRGGMDGRDGG